MTGGEKCAWYHDTLRFAVISFSSAVTELPIPSQKRLPRALPSRSTVPIFANGWHFGEEQHHNFPRRREYCQHSDKSQDRCDRVDGWARRFPAAHSGVTQFWLNGHRPTVDRGPFIRHRLPKQRQFAGLL